MTTITVILFAVLMHSAPTTDFFCLAHADREPSVAAVPSLGWSFKMALLNLVSSQASLNLLVNIVFQLLLHLNGVWIVKQNHGYRRDEM